MDFHQLRVFQAAATYGGFTRAAGQLHVSQSTVSQHIKQLEADLGCPLFLRVGKRVLVSEAGTVLLQYADRIFQDLTNAEMAVREMSALKRGTVRLGVGATTLTYRLPRILGGYNRRFPEIELVVVTGTTEFLLAAVKGHQVDLAIVMSPREEQGMRITPLGTEELVIVLNHNHAMARKTVLLPDDLRKLRFISYEKKTKMQNLIDSYFQTLGFAPQIAMEVESIEAMKSLVRAGLGASVLPLCAVGDRVLAARLRVLRVKGAPLFRHLGLATLDTAMQPRAITEFARTLTACLADAPPKSVVPL
jgi:DNA-binding transcriptional LysR family regulator